MSDQGNQWLLQQIKQGSGDELVCVCDTFFNDAENIVAGTQSHLYIFSNRYHLAPTNSLKVTKHFSDFDFSLVKPQSLNAFYLRIPKEKALCHYLINQAGKLLKPGGTLFLAGYKNEGIKTYFKKARGYLQGSFSEDKNQGASCIQIQSTHMLSNELDCNDYQRLREVSSKNSITFFSKPGLFGWEKIDKGSQLLVDQFNSIAQQLPKDVSVLDLGCGYGFLSLSAIDKLLVKQITATDNNAAALTCCEYNLKQLIHNRQLKTTYQVLPSHGGNEIKSAFDLVLCNPPFHQGFAHDSSLIQLFLSNASRLLKPQGSALFVVNDFIPLERHATEYFKAIVRLAKADGFTVYSLYKT